VQNLPFGGGTSAVGAAGIVFLHSTNWETEKAMFFALQSLNLCNPQVHLHPSAPLMSPTSMIDGSGCKRTAGTGMAITAVQKATTALVHDDSARRDRRAKDMREPVARGKALRETDGGCVGAGALRGRSEETRQQQQQVQGGGSCASSQVTKVRWVSEGGDLVCEQTATADDTCARSSLAASFQQFENPATTEQDALTGAVATNHIDTQPCSSHSSCANVNATAQRCQQTPSVPACVRATADDEMGGGSAGDLGHVLEQGAGRQMLLSTLECAYTVSMTDHGKAGDGQAGDGEVATEMEAPSIRASQEGRFKYSSNSCQDTDQRRSVTLGTWKRATDSSKEGCSFGMQGSGSLGPSSTASQHEPRQGSGCEAVHGTAQTCALRRPSSAPACRPDLVFQHAVVSLPVHRANGWWFSA
jgi:hypothetical protein